MNTKKDMRYSIILIVLGIVTLFNIQAYAQYRSLYSHYMLNTYEINPAYGGLDFSLKATAIYKTQYQRIQGSPQNVYFGIHMPFYIWNGSVGMQVNRKSLGTFSINSLDLSYNYIYDNGYGLLSFGGRIGASLINIDGKDIITPDGQYDFGIDHQDNILAINNELGIGPRWDVGTYFYNSRIEVGISLSHLPPADLYFSEYNITQKLQSNAYFEYKIEYNDELNINSSILFNTDFYKVQTHISSIVELNGNVFGGIGIRGYNTNSLDALSFMMGIRFNNNYTISYNYDYILSELNIVSEGGHEILFSYNLKKPIATGLPPKIIYNPRFL